MDKSLESAETSPVYLRTCIVEPILITCLKERSFYDIYNSVQDIESISERTLRKYLYHLINEEFLKYHAERKVFVTSSWGADLLVLIYNQIQQNQTFYLDLKIKVG